MNRKLRSVRSIARRRGGELLTTVYVDASTRMRWRCAEGHEWQATAASVGAGKWCARCAGVAKRPLGELQEHARSRGGELLSRVCANGGVPVRWSCAAGHHWSASANQVMGEGTWCPRCRGSPRDDLLRLQRIARRHGGQCLSREYRGTAVPLLWSCRKGHEWRTKPHTIVSGSWCPICRARAGPHPVLTLEDMKAAADERGGKCLSTTYLNSKTHLRWRCARGHEFEATAKAVRCRAQWCRTCSHSVRGTIDGLRNRARELGGACLSASYDDPRVPLRWRCAKGHRFEALALAVKSGVWCPRCSSRSTRSSARRRGAAKPKEKANGRCHR